MEQSPILNEHNKQEYPPMHTDRTDTSLKNIPMLLLLLMGFISYFAGCQSPQMSNNESVAENNNVTDSTYIQDTIDGWLTPYIAISQVIEHWGDPDSMSEATVWGVDGALHQSWYYLKKNVQVDVYGDSTEVAKSRLALSVEGIAITGPTECKMRHSIAIGDSREKVEQTYQGYINDEYSNKEQIAIGDQMPYWGLIYFFKDEKLKGMYNGSLAE